MIRRSTLFLLLAGAALLLLTGCVQDWQVRPTPLPVTKPLPSSTQTESSTPLPSPTWTSAPLTSTAEPPTATSPSSTATSVPPTITSAPPTATSVPAPQAVRLQFPAGGTTMVTHGVARPGTPSRFVLWASRGQILDVQVAVPMAQATLAIWGADGTSLKRAGDDRLWWRGSLPSSQDYYLEITSPGGERAFTLSVAIPVRISFASGETSARVDGSVQPGVPDLFVLKAMAGQTMEVVLDSPSAATMLAIWGFDGTTLQATGDPSRHWVGTLPGTQDYFLYLYNDSASASYRLDVSIPAGGEPQPVRISFPAGGTSATATGHLAAMGKDVYVLRAGANQILDVAVDWSGGQVLLEIWGADGSVLKHGAVDGTLWRGYLPATQDYFVSVIAEGGAADYTLRVSIPARISFAAGAISATVTGRVASYGSVLYVIRAAAGQEMTVELEAVDPNVLPTIWGFDGTVLKRYVDGAQAWTGTLPSTQDYFIDISSFGGAADYSLTVTIP